MIEFATALQRAREEYAKLGYDTLPLLPHSKQPAVSGWPRRSPSQMWADAPPNANIGIRGGGTARIAIIDCDEKDKPGTYQYIRCYLEGLGFTAGSYPLVQTASQIGRQIYLSLLNPPTGNYKVLNPKIGAGEFRYGQGAQVVAVPSVVGGSIYKLINGQFDRLSEIDFNEITPILLKPSNSENDGCVCVRKPSRFARQLLEGDIPSFYKSRSEAECAVVLSLINTGFGINEILRLFLSNPVAGKFAELNSQNPKNAIRWLWLTYQNALEYANNNTSPGRQLAKAAIAWAQSRPWPGRTGAYDRAILLAHAHIAWKSGAITYAASCRTLAELANVSRTAANNATNRLLKHGYIKLEAKAVANLANLYSLRKGLTLPHYPPVRKCQGFSTHDVFCFGGLGKSSLLIWEALLDGPMTIEELIASTGKIRKTIEGWLGEMEKIVDPMTGEIFSMVYQENDMWYANPEIDLDQIAQILDVAGKGRQRKNRHQRERESHGRALHRGRIRNAS